MGDKLFNEDAVVLLWHQWRDEPVQRRKDWLFTDLWKATEPLARSRITEKVMYFTAHCDFDDYLSLVQRKFPYAIGKFNPSKARLYSLLVNAFDKVIKGKLSQLRNGKTKKSVPTTCESELDSFNDADEGEHRGFEKLEVAFIRQHGGCHGGARKHSIWRTSKGTQPKRSN